MTVLFFTQEPALAVPMPLSLMVIKTASTMSTGDGEAVTDILSWMP